MSGYNPRKLDEMLAKRGATRGDPEITVQRKARGPQPVKHNAEDAELLAQMYEGTLQSLKAGGKVINVDEILPRGEAEKRLAELEAARKHLLIWKYPEIKLHAKWYNPSPDDYQDRLAVYGSDDRDANRKAEREELFSGNPDTPILMSFWVEPTKPKKTTQKISEEAAAVAKLDLSLDDEKLARQAQELGVRPARLRVLHRPGAAEYLQTHLDVEEAKQPQVKHARRAPRRRRTGTR